MNQTALRSLKTMRKRDHSDLMADAEKYRAEMSEFARRFTPRRLRTMSEDQFREFLASGRWSNLPRLQGWLTGKRWHSVRSRLSILVDDRVPLEKRLEQACPEQRTDRIPYLRQAVITGVLHTVWPERCGVWNGTSLRGLQALGLQPEVPRGATFTTRYFAINGVLQSVATTLKVDLVMLDLLWYRMLNGKQSKGPLWKTKRTSLSDKELFEEGDRVTREHKVLERNSTLVRLAKDQWTALGTKYPACEVCGWTMKDVYGDAAGFFIEAHHRDMLSRSKHPVRHGVEALCPVCPNCHRMLHLSEYSIEKLRSIVKRHGMTRS